MPFPKGKSGNPGGRPKDRAFTDMLRLAVTEVDAATGKLKLRLIAERLADAAVAGESWAIQQVGDRLDGKPHQQVAVATEEEELSLDEMTDEQLLAIIQGGGAKAAA